MHILGELFHHDCGRDFIAEFNEHCGGADNEEEWAEDQIVGIHPAHVPMLNDPDTRHDSPSDPKSSNSDHKKDSQDKIDNITHRT